MSWRDRVSTVVIAMTENRSFDHMLGHLRLEGIVPVDGLEPPLEAYQNPYQGRAYHPFPRQRDDPLASDLPHEWDQVAVQLGADPFAMGGFVEAYARMLGRDPGPEPDPMGFFPSELVPVTSFLARSYCTCDRWHCPLPTSTQPNRTMAFCGESGIFDTASGPRLIEAEDILLDWLDRAGVRWRVYHDGLSFFALFPLAWKHLLGDRFRDFDDYLGDMQREGPGTAPQVIVVEPSYDDAPHLGGDRPNDNHPPLPVGWGEAFLRRVYQGATANPDLWAGTVLLVCCDEHGGFFDHVAPPPIGYRTVGDPAHEFRSLGPRIPGIVVSPLVKPGSVCSQLLDHTSMLQLLAELFTPGRPYSASVDQRRRQGIGSLSAALGDEPRPDVPAAPSVAVPVAAPLVERAPAPSGMRASFEHAARQLAQRHPAETRTKYPKLFDWMAAVEAAR